MQDHHRALLKERLEYHLRNRYVFAELDTGGRIIQCPNCHVPFIPHLGNWIADKFQCKSCKAGLSFRNSTAKTARCPCCNISRPLPNNLITLVCGGCQVKVIHQKSDKAVKCSECKHINIPTVGRTYGVRPPYQVPPQASQNLPPAYLAIHGQAYQLVRTQFNQGSPQVNGVGLQVNQDPPQGNQVDPQQVNRAVPLQVNQDPQQVNRFVPPRVYYRRIRAATAETESTASSSNFAPKTEITVVDYPDCSVAEAVRNVATKRVVEDKTEAAGSKKTCL